jgi:hypothetical protein
MRREILVIPGLPPKTSLLFNELYLEVNEKIRPSKARPSRTDLPKTTAFQHGTTIAREWRVTAPATSYIR